MADMIIVAMDDGATVVAGQIKLSLKAFKLKAFFIFNAYFKIDSNALRRL